MDHNELARRCCNGEVAAARELIDMQREGKALRLYPFGRNGALDEGMVPMLIGLNEHGMITIEVGKVNQFIIRRAAFGKMANAMMKAIAACMIEFDDEDEPFVAMRPYTTGDFELESRGVIANGVVTGIEFRFHPGEPLKWEIGAFQACQILAALVCLVEQADLEPDDCGFTEDDFEDACLFADWAIRSMI